MLVSKMNTVRHIAFGTVIALYQIFASQSG
jgi:hypothetical protein